MPHQKNHPTSQKSLYERVLGEEVEHLSPVVRDAHTRPQGVEAKGLFAVRHGEGWLRRTLAWLMRLPPASTETPVTLHVEVHGDEERWVRTFGKFVFSTRQYARGGLLWEVLWPVSVGMVLSAKEGALYFTTQKIRILGLPWPLWLSPCPFAVASQKDETTWHIRVSVSLPVLGEIASYTGDISSLEKRPS
ncbi:MAG: DUF4166 domain-containing protein [Myxococcales bacterium]|nr:DUF4166 domain-containing protein [Myxococcales bacterium]MCB9642570.1 DUF4166 domain-containing protein [Myxococcales bacterium]